MKLSEMMETVSNTYLYRYGDECQEAFKAEVLPNG